MKYCTRFSMVEAMQYHDNPDTLTKVLSWLGQFGRAAHRCVLLQTTNLVERVEDGEYIVKINDGQFHRFTPEDFDEHYVAVKA